MPPGLTFILAITFEIIATTSLKLSEGFTKLIPSIVVIVGYIVSFYMLSLTLQSMNLGIVYAIWSGVGTIGVAIIGVLLWGEKITLVHVIGMVFIIIGVIILNIFAEGAHGH